MVFGATRVVGVSSLRGPRPPTVVQVTRILLTILVLTSFATSSEAGPAGATCAKVCKRVASCRLLSYDPCMDMCGQQGAEDTAESRASNLVQAKLSCAALADQMAPTDWLCTAEGASSYGYDMDGSMPDVWGTQDIYLFGTGKTRAAAVYSAISSCNSIMTLQLATQRTTEFDAATTSECHITQCIAPASARKKQR